MGTSIDKYEELNGQDVGDSSKENSLWNENTTYDKIIDAQIKSVKANNEKKQQEDNMLDFPEKEIGKKFSQDKAPMGIILKQFPLALEAVAERTEFGHKKYLEYDRDYMNFKRVPDAENQYFNAAVRHLAGIGEENDLEHIKAAAWCVLAHLQLKLENN